MALLWTCSSSNSSTYVISHGEEVIANHLNRKTFGEYEEQFRRNLVIVTTDHTESTAPWDCPTRTVRSLFLKETHYGVDQERSSHCKRQSQLQGCTEKSVLRPCEMYYFMQGWWECVTVVDCLGKGSKREKKMDR